MNIAIWLTLSRLFLLPLAVFPVIGGWAHGWLISAAVAALAGLTDILDGYISRITGRISNLGTNLDLISDKVFIGAMFAFTAWLGLIPAWIPVVVVLREAVISGVRFYRFRTHTPAPDALGKAKTAVSFAAIVLILARREFGAGGALDSPGAQMPLSLLLSVTPYAVYAAVILTLVSGVNYLVKYNLSVQTREPQAVETGPDTP